MPNRPPRLPEFDYRGQFQYFLTVCVKNRRPIFLDVALGRSVIDLFLHIATEEKFEVVAYCVMPDHVHTLVEGLTERSDLARLIHRWKLMTGFWWRTERNERSRLWQGGYYDHVLRERDPESGVVSDIIANPVRAGLVDDVVAYPLSGSSRYSLRSLADTAMDWTPDWK